MPTLEQQASMIAGDGTMKRFTGPEEYLNFSTRFHLGSAAYNTLMGLPSDAMMNVIMAAIKDRVNEGNMPAAEAEIVVNNISCFLQFYSND